MYATKGSFFLQIERLILGMISLHDDEIDSCTCDGRDLSWRDDERGINLDGWDPPLISWISAHKFHMHMGYGMIGWPWFKIQDMMRRARMIGVQESHLKGRLFSSCGMIPYAWWRIIGRLWLCAPLGVLVWFHTDMGCWHDMFWIQMKGWFECGAYPNWVWILEAWDLYKNGTRSLLTNTPDYN